MIKKLILLKKDLENINEKDRILLLNHYYFFEFFSQINNKNYEVLDHFTKNKNYFFYLKECKKIYDSIVLDFCREFKKIHSLNYSDDTCILIFGPWLQQFIEICYERYQSLKKLFLVEKIKKIKIIEFSHLNLALKDHINIYENSINQKWNFILISKIINFFKITKKFELDNSILKTVNFNDETNYKINFKNRKIRIINFLFSFLNKKKNFSLIHQSYLSFLEEKKLEILLNQTPSFFDFKYDINMDYNAKLRQNLNFFKSTTLSIENFIRKILPTSIPISYLENFKILKEKTFLFPQKPKFILSANSFEFNALFKIYSAEQKEKKSKIFSVQHGNGSSLIPNSILLKDHSFCDKYITWGHKIHKNDIPLFNFKTKQIKIINKSLFLNIVMRPAGAYVRIFDRHFETLNIIKFLDFLKLNLNHQIKENIKIKPHNSFFTEKKNKANIYLSKFLKKTNFKTYSKDISFYNTLSESKILLFTYNSTGILDALRMNIPIICFWKEGYKSINIRYFDKFKKLEKAKIFFFDEKKLIKHLDKIWNNVQVWWEDDETREAINYFNKNLNNAAPKDKLKTIAKKLNILCRIK